MALVLGTTPKNELLETLVALIDAADPTPGKLLLYTTPQPANGAAITTQTLLATLPLAMPCGTVASGTLTLDTIDDVDAVASGNAVWGRLLDGNDTFVGDFDIGNLASSAFCKIDVPTIYDGNKVTITSGTISI